MFTQSPNARKSVDDDLALRRYLRQAFAGNAVEIELTSRNGRTRGWSFVPPADGGTDLEPKLTQWDPWGNRVDQIEHTPLWKSAERLASEKGAGDGT